MSETLHMSPDVEWISHTWITMPDGAKLGARIWLPVSAKQSPVPAILEYIPYRKDDYSAVRDSSTIAYFATQDYACIRVDMRGSGSSDGVMYDEYSEIELQDGEAILKWIADQEWCDGNIGMIGISWGGITGLQLAQRQAEHLNTVIALGATEFRYYDDAGYYMGCMVGQTLGWATIMFGYNTRPPDPELVGENWMETWLKRLEETPHYLEKWLDHQHVDDYWLHADVGSDYKAIQIPIYAVSGHADCWPNTVPRLLENLDSPRRGLQGAWCHRYPHLGIPGPTIGFLQDATRWFDQWLKKTDTKIMQEAMYQVYIQDSVRPATYYDKRPGRWVGEETWPSSQVTSQIYYLSSTQRLSTRQTEKDTKRLIECCSPQTVGMASGEYMPWFAFGPAEELPGDQQGEDSGSAVFDTAPLTKKIDVLGSPTVEITFTCDHPQALLAARLCDIWPDGASTFITRGIVNLSQRNGKSNPQSLIPGEQYTVTITLNHVGYSIPPGHCLRLAVSTSYWPMAWPSPDITIVDINPRKSKLHLPTRSANAEDGKLTQFAPPLSLDTITTTSLRPVKQERKVKTNKETGVTELEIFADNGNTRFEHNKLEMGSTSLQRYSIHPNDPLSAQAEYEWNWEYAREGKWNITTQTRTLITCDRHYFYLDATCIAKEQGTEVFHKKWAKKFNRDHF